MPSGAFVGETVDAHLTRTVFGPTREIDAVALCLSTKHAVGITLWFLGSLVAGARLAIWRDGR
jgi:hypothetical protein